MDMYEQSYQLNVELSSNLAAAFNRIMDHRQVQSYPYGDILERPSSGGDGIYGRQITDRDCVVGYGPVI